MRRQCTQSCVQCKEIVTKTDDTKNRKERKEKSQRLSVNFKEGHEVYLLIMGSGWCLGNKETKRKSGAEVRECARNTQDGAIRSQVLCRKEAGRSIFLSAKPLASIFLSFKTKYRKYEFKALHQPYIDVQRERVLAFDEGKCSLSIETSINID